MREEKNGTWLIMSSCYKYTSRFVNISKTTIPFIITKMINTTSIIRIKPVAKAFQYKKNKVIIELTNIQYNL